MNRDEILAAVEAERGWQREKWNRAHEWGYGDCSSEPGSLGPYYGYRFDVAGGLESQYSSLIKASVLEGIPS
jgi:hypothetical protein